MSGMMMDNKPFSDRPELLATTEHERPPTPAIPDLTHIPLVPGDHKSTGRAILSGPDRMWVIPRWLLYLVMAWVVFQVEGWLVISAQSHLGANWWRLVIEASMMMAAIVPGFVMARIDRQPFGAFGLPARRAFGKNFWAGAFWGLISLSILMLMLRGSGAFEFGAMTAHGARIAKFAVYYAIFFLITGLFEEFLVRGYSLWVLSRGVTFWPAAAFLSIAFGAIHSRNPGETLPGLIGAAVIGFFFCLTLRRTGDLWWAVGFHMSWDWGESYLYSVPDSGALLPGHLLSSSFHGPDWLTGGTAGPEGSYLVFVLIAALWLLFDRRYPQVKYGE